MERLNDEDLFKRELADLLNKYEVDQLLGGDAEDIASIMYAPLNMMIYTTLGRTN